MKYFQSVTTLEDLKKQYRKLSLELHPDRGGEAAEFIAMKAEYDVLFKQMNTKNEKHGAYSSIIDSIINFDLDIEIIGTWVWITGGNTYAVKSQLKEIGFKWASKKKAWYWHEGAFVKNNKKQFSMDDLRTMHESTVVKNAGRQFALNA